MKRINQISVISIIIPVRNGESYIVEAVQSALRQGTIVDEVLVIDDGSSDRTAQLVLAMEDGRVRLIAGDQQSGGVSAVRNQGLALARAPWVMFLDADDRVKDGALQTLLDHAGDSDTGVYGDYQRINDHGAVIGQRRFLSKRQKPSGAILEPLLGGNFIVNGGVMLVRRAVFAALGGFDQRFAYAEDWHAWCRLAAEGTITYVAGCHVLDYRVHTQSVMMKKPLTLDDCLPAVDAVFDDPKIRQSVAPERRAALKTKAIGHMEAYCVSQAIRGRRYGLALKGLSQTLVQKPKRFPRMALLAGAAWIGL